MSDRYTLGWHDRGPRPPLPLAVDTWGTHASEVFVSEDRARAEVQDRNAAWNAFMATPGLRRNP